ncbi:MAG: hypothetical protein ACN4GW_05800 [Desulforhopalus sp.]
MRSVNDLWEAIGSISEEETHHLLTKLFDMYEKRLESDPDDPEAAVFFQNLNNALNMTTECNLNRR